MNIFDALILGAVQGFTEFLPISSSGHLVIGQYLLGLSLPGQIFEVLVHLGTLLSVMVVFKKDIVEIIVHLFNERNQQLAGAIIIGTVPAVIVGLTLKDSIGDIFENITAVSISLVATGIWLITTKAFKNKNHSVNIKRGFIIGCIQAIAIIPGISRSGTTIGMAMFLGISPEKAARFSFLLAIPAIAGAGLLTALDLDASSLQGFSVISMLAAFLSSFLVGWFSLSWLLKCISKGKFHWFGVYCLFVGFLTLIFQ